jgi:hypothetical protein
MKDRITKKLNTINKKLCKIANLNKHYNFQNFRSEPLFWKLKLFLCSHEKVKRHILHWGCWKELIQITRSKTQIKSHLPLFKSKDENKSSYKKVPITLLDSGHVGLPLFYHNVIHERRTIEH